MSGLDPTLLDLTGYRCPVPVIRLEAALRRAENGHVFKVIADDPVAAVDIPHFCRQAGHGVERCDSAPEFCVFLVTATAKQPAARA